MDNPKDPRAIAFTENRDYILSALSQSCETAIEIDADSAQFPLAQNDVSHISCAGPRTPKGLIDRSVFVIADDKFAAVELRGGAIAALVSPRTDEPMDYLQFKVFDQGR